MAVLYRTNAQSRALEEAFRRAGRAVPAGRRHQLLRAARGEGPAGLSPAGRQSGGRRGVPPRHRRAPPRAGRDQPRDAGPARRSQWSKPLLETARGADAHHRPPPQRARGVPQLRRRSSTALAQRAGSLAPADVLEQLIRAIDYEARAPGRGARGRRPVGERARARGQRGQLVGGGGRRRTTTARRWSGSWPRLRCCRRHDTVVGNEDGVTLMTLHTAKGLEWPVVVLTGLEHGLFPLARAEEQPDGLEEERRLCYVGLTRAKDKLYLTWARARRRGGELRPGMPSRFLRAIAAGDRGRTADDLALGAGLGCGRADGPAVGPVSGPDRESRCGDPRPAVAPVRPSAAEEASQDTPRYVKGERVRHRRFGSGTIQGLTGAGRDLKVSVAFDDDGSRRQTTAGGLRRVSSANGRAHEHRSGRRAARGEAGRAGGQGRGPRPDWWTS